MPWPLVALAFLVVPFVELFVLLRVGGAIGVGWTIAVVVAVSVAGSWLVKREGVATWRRLTSRLQAGALPGGEVVDGALILFAGALMLTPGFVTDAVALLLLLPPTRAVARAYALKRLAGRLEVRRRRGGPPWGGDGGDVIDVGG